MRGVVYFIMGVILGVCIGYQSKGHCPIPKYQVVTEYDTVIYHTPAPESNRTLKYVPRILALTWRDTIHIYPDSLREILSDSISVEVPIEQRHYRDSLYEAWVSGYDPQLDSIRVFSSTQYSLVQPTASPKRWGVGVTAGYGFGPKGALPYIGVGISYNIFTW